MKARRDVYQAIADPTRRAIIDMVANGPHNVNAIAAQFDVSRQAISLHLQILAECGLLVVTRQGRDRICKVDPGRLSEVSEWVDRYRQHWEQRIDAMEAYLEQLKKHRNEQQQK